MSSRKDGHFPFLDKNCACTKNKACVCLGLDQGDLVDVLAGNEAGHLGLRVHGASGDARGLEDEVGPRW